MKKLLVFIFILIAVSDLFSQNINQYLPLKIGNKWVYDCTGADYSGYSHDRVTITIYDTTIYAGKKYFNYSKTVVHIAGNVTFNPGMFLFGGFAPIRLDSLNGNIYFLMQGQGCAYSLNEVMTDSLNAKPNDTVKIHCASSNYFYKCIDTSGQRYFNVNFAEQRSRLYMSNIGLQSSFYLIHLSTTPTYSQNLIGRVINGIAYGDTNSLVGISSATFFKPAAFNISQNYPNPFNPSTKIKFDISKLSFAEIKIYDVLGNEVADLMHEQLKPGSYEVDWDGSNSASGLYFYKLIAGDYVATKKMVLLK